MTCPKCHSWHIVDGRCVMCGMLVSDVYRVQERYCLCCARKLPIIGDTCPECEAAIHLGAVALVEARLRNRKTEKKILPATCPASALLEALYQKFRRRHEKSLQYQAAYRERKRAAFLALSPEEQKAQLAARRESEAYKRKQQTNKAAYDRMMADPERAAKHRERRNAYEAREDVKQRKRQRYARSAALKKLIKENELLDREREAAQYERQWEALGAEDCGNSGAVWGDSLRGNNAGESQLGVVVNGRVCTAEGPQVAEDGTMGI